ncbi:TPA: DUF2482 family protein [Staphylococcus aureus]|nr:DUF2482 family protein [Staphylococcus aureus]
MTKNYKDMTQDELRDLLGEKSSELYELAKEIDEETEFDILLFSSIGVSDRDCTSSSSSVIGSVYDLAELLDNITDDHDIANVIKIWRLQKFLGIDDDKED